MHTSDVLTRREQEVFEECIAGLSDKEIGSHLRISASTVKTHQSRIRLKLGVRNRFEMLMLKHHEDCLGCRFRGGSRGPAWG